MQKRQYSALLWFLILLWQGSATAAPYNWGTTGVADVSTVQNIVEITDNSDADTLNSTFSFVVSPWSSDGQWIVYSAKTQGASGPWGVCKIHPSSSGFQSLTEGFLDPTDTGARGPSFAPDTSIFFTRYTATALDIWRMNSDGSGKVNLTASNSRTNEKNPVVSPDGNSYAYTSIGSLWVADIDGSNAIKISGGVTLGVSQYSWSPDSQWIVYRGEEGANEWLYKAKSDGTVNAELTKPPLFFDTQVHSQPAWSPDGTKIAYIWYKTDGSNSYYNLRVRSMESLYNEESIDSASSINLPGWSSLSGSVSWSPDSTMVSYSKLYSDTTSSRVLMIADISKSNAPIQLTTGYVDSIPYWSPRGNQIVFQDDG